MHVGPIPGTGRLDVMNCGCGVKLVCCSSRGVDGCWFSCCVWKWFDWNCGCCVWNRSGWNCGCCVWKRLVWNFGCCVWNISGWNCGCCVWNRSDWNCGWLWNTCCGFGNNCSWCNWLLWNVNLFSCCSGICCCSWTSCRWRVCRCCTDASSCWNDSWTLEMSMSSTSNTSVAPANKTKHWLLMFPWNKYYDCWKNVHQIRKHSALTYIFLKINTYSMFK